MTAAPPPNAASFDSTSSDGYTSSDDSGTSRHTSPDAETGPDAPGPTSTVTTSVPARPAARPASPSSVAELVRAIAGGARVKYVFFWGHRPLPDGSIGASCFSQWWPSPFTVDGTEFATAEHYMMWRKAMLFGDADAAAEVLRVGHPQEAKAVGRRVRDFDDVVWSLRRFDIVTAANVAKFSQHEDLRAFLLGTGDRVLVEASPRDRIWGIGMGASNENAPFPDRWRGLNLLGFALMRARDELRAASSSEPTSSPATPPQS